MNYHTDLLKYLMTEMRNIYQEEFNGEVCYVLYGNVYYRNWLHGNNDIDSVGYNALFIFEHIQFFTYEILWHAINDY